MSNNGRRSGFGGRGGLNDDRGGRGGLNDDRGGRSGLNDDRGGRGGLNDDRGGRGGLNDDRGGRGGLHNDRGGRGGLHDDRGGRGGLQDDRGGRGGLQDDRGGRGELNDDRGGRGGLNDDRGGRGLQNDDRGGRSGQNDDRMGKGGRGGRRFDSSERDRSPLRDDKLREPFGDSFRGGRPRQRFPPRGDYGPRDPYFREPSPRRGFPEPWLADDPYRQDPYADPFVDPYRSRAPPPPIVECEIFVQNGQLRTYGDAVERRVKDHSIITGVSIMPEGQTPQQLVEELTSQNALFAIFINPQNEIHRSLTLNILHGTPQEHRNMPLDDAIALVGRSFFKYVDELREKAQAAATPLASTSNRIFLPPSSEVTYLLNLLADNRAVTIPEINTVIKYLEDRRDKMIDAESRPIADDQFGNTPPLQHIDHTQSPNQESAGAIVKDPALLHKDLTNKIYNLFSGTGGSIQGVPPANGTQQQPPLPKLPSGTPAPPLPSQVPVPSNASLINFDNPNVQKALDNLIQSSPSLLKNINAKVSLPTSQMDTSSVSNNMGAISSSSYRHMGGMNSGQPQGPMGGMNSGQPQGPMGGMNSGQFQGPMGGMNSGQVQGQMGGMNSGQAQGQLGGMNSGQAQGQLGGMNPGQAQGQMGGMDSGQAQGQMGGMIPGQAQGQMMNNQSQQYLQGGFGGFQGQQLPGTGQGFQGPGPSPQDIFNILGQGMLGFMGQGFGPSGF